LAEPPTFMMDHLFQGLYGAWRTWSLFAIPATSEAVRKPEVYLELFVRSADAINCRDFLLQSFNKLIDILAACRWGVAVTLSPAL